MISKESFTGNDRGVSPVIGVILMVAVTVVLAAVIGASVLDVGNDVGESPSAAVDYDGDETFTILSAQNVDEVFAQNEALEDGEVSIGEEAGESVTLVEDDVTAGETLESGDTINIVGEVNGDSQVLQTFEYDGEQFSP